MARDITVSFNDGSQHVYQGAPDDVTPQQIQERAQRDFGKQVTALDGGRKPQAAPPPAPVQQAPAPAPTQQQPQGVDAGAAPPPPPQGMMEFLMGSPRAGHERPQGMAGDAMDFLTNRARDIAATGETALSVGSAATTGFIGGILNMGNRIAQQITGIVSGKSADEINAQGPDVEGAFTQGMAQNTYQPRLPQAQEQTETIGKAMQEHGPALMGIGPELGAVGGILRGGARDAAMLAGDRVGAAVTPKISPQRAVNVKAGMEQGVVPAPHQLADNKYVKKYGETLESVPLSGGAEARETRVDQFHEALAKQINPDTEGATHLTPDVFKAAMDRSGGGISQITSAYSIPAEELAGDFAALRRQLKRETPDNAHMINGYLDEFEQIAQENGGVIPGENFKSMNSELGRKIRDNAGTPTGHLLSDLQDTVMDAFRNQLPDDVRPQYDAFRAQYAKAKTILPLFAKATEGRISPDALMGAINKTKAGQNSMALGYAGELGDLARAGKLLVDSKSSGTAELSLIHKFITKPLQGAAKVATLIPAAKVYNKVGPAVTRAMVRRGLANAPEGMVPELPPGEAPPEGTPPIGGGPSGPTEPQGTPPAPTDPRLAEIAKMREASTDPAVQAALDAHEKTVQADIKTKAADAKRMASVDALEKAAQATQDADLKATLQKQADKLRGEKIPVGEAKEIPMPEVKPEKVGKIPVGQAIEGQPEIPTGSGRPPPVGEATEITPETIEPQEPIPVGEASEAVSNVPKSEPVSNVPRAERELTSNRGSEPSLTSNVPKAEADAYQHRELFAEADRRGIEVRGRRPSEVREAVRAHIKSEVGDLEFRSLENVAKAMDIDPAAVENAAVQHDRSRNVFDRKIKEILEQENATETNRAAEGSKGAANDDAGPGPEGGPGGGRGGNANRGSERAQDAATGAREPASSVQATGEQPRADGAAATGSDSQAGATGGQAEAIPVGDVSEVHEPEAIPTGEATELSPAANNASGESEASQEAINRAEQEKARGQDRVLVERDGTVRPLFGPGAVDQVAKPGQVIAQRGVGAKEWTVLSSGSDLTKGGVNRALAKLEGRPVGFEKGAAKPAQADSGLVESMPRAVLLSKIERFAKMSRAVNDEMIEAGRGNELASETMKKDDPLSRKFQMIRAAESAFESERRRRMEYQGTEHPIKRKA